MVDSADGRPGERFLSPSRSFYPPSVCADESREDFRVVLDRHGGTFASVCLHPILDEREVEQSARSSLGRLLEMRRERSSGPASVTIAGRPGFGHTTHSRSSTLTDWKLGYEGWLFVIGVLTRRNRRLHERALEQARIILATWEWLPPTPKPFPSPNLTGPRFPPLG
ncbi:MAG TPA: hypothetical protein VN618_01280 [Solirubrobacteraceae bacterium]|nr:hypothetical protein [Solirubrobacteraceae bacterium]